MPAKYRVLRTEIIRNSSNIRRQRTRSNMNTESVETEALRHDTTETDTDISEIATTTVYISYSVDSVSNDGSEAHKTRNIPGVFDDEQWEYLEDPDLPNSDCSDLDDPHSQVNSVTFQETDNYRSDSKNANIGNPVKVKKPPGYKGGKIDHKSPHLCLCQHCYVFNVQNLYHEVTMDVAAVSHDAKPGDETFDMPEIPMRLGRRAVEDNNMNNNDINEDEDSNADENKLWNLYDGLDNFVEEWGNQLRVFSCRDSILKTFSNGASWTFKKLYTAWKMLTTCRKVAPFQDSGTDLGASFAQDDEFNGNHSLGRRTNSCEF